MLIAFSEKSQPLLHPVSTLAMTVLLAVVVGEVQVQGKVTAMAMITGRRRRRRRRKRKRRTRRRTRRRRRKRRRRRRRRTIVVVAMKTPYHI